MMNSDWPIAHSSLIGYLSLTALSQSELSFQSLFVVCLNAFEQHTFSNRAMIFSSDVFIKKMGGPGTAALNRL